MLIRAIIETVCVLLMSCLCAWTGLRITRRNSKAWIASFGFAFVFVIAVMLLHRIPVLTYRPFFSYLANGKNEFFVMAACLPFIFAILVPRLPQNRQKWLVGVFAFLITFYYVFPPFIDPALLYMTMKNTDTWIEDGVCLQTTNYTCGAASAVTALRQFGLNASESEIAFASSTSRSWGVSERALERTINNMYGSQGVKCRTKLFDDAAELKDCCPVLAIVKFKFMVDHFVTVLEVQNDHVLIADPMSGKKELTCAEFNEQCRGIGIVVSKEKGKENEI